MRRSGPARQHSAGKYSQLPRSRLTASSSPPSTVGADTRGA